MGDRKYQVYGLGNALVDYELEISDEFLRDHQVEKGMMTLVAEEQQEAMLRASHGQIRKRQSGGSAANSMIAIAQLGGNAFYTCKVADDEDGRMYQEEMSALGIDTNLDALPRGTTGKCLVMVTPDSQRTMNTYLGITADLGENELRPDAIGMSEFLYIEGYLVSSPQGMRAIRKAKEIARESGTRIAYTFSDPSMVKFFNDQSQEAVDGDMDMLFANDIEAQLFTGTGNDDDAFEALKAHAHQFVMTRSAKGAWIFDGAQKIEIAPHPVNAVDSTGAGDMFAGAYLYGLTHGMLPENAGNLASLLSAQVVTQFGPRLDHKKVNELFSSFKKEL
jgi:sugar/nucleoside kinase (ribokinase family)